MTPAAAPSVASDWTRRRRAGVRRLGDPRWSQGWVQIAWSALVRPRLPSAPVRLSLQAEAPAEAEAADEAAGALHVELAVPVRGALVAEVSDAMGADERRRRAARLARLGVRTLSRVAAVGAVREKHGEVAGALAALLASGLEAADTRGWHLLPGRLAVLRVTVPARPLAAQLQVGSGGNGIPVALAPLEARPGSVHVRTARIWRDPPGSGGTVALAPPVTPEGKALVPH